MFVAEIALDPGGVTGVAMKMDDESILTAPYDNYGMFEVYELLDKFVLPRQTIVICERFFAGGRIGQPGESTLQLIGAVHYACWSKPCDLYMRTPQHRLAFVGKSRAYLIEHGKGYTIHEVDALAHLFAWEYSHGAKTLMEET